MLFKSNKENNQKQEKSFLKAKEDIDNNKEELVNRITIYYTCIKVLLG
jgi:hypothetical protein